MPRSSYPSPVVLALLLLTLAAPATAAAAPADGPDRQTPAPTGRVVIRFTAPADAADRARVAALAGAPLADRVDRSLLQRAAAKAAGPSPALAALGRYVHCEPPRTDTATLRRLVHRLAADPAVATAFLEPRVVPAALGFDAFTGATPPRGGRINSSGRTDAFTDQQGYLDDAPVGIGAESVWAEPGARGSTVRIIDIEGAWLWTHEDLPAPFADLGAHIDDLAWRNHGTAVMGELVGRDDGQGVTGIVPAAAGGAASIGDQSVAQALLAAAAVLDPGDLVLIELHAPGPNASGEGQHGYVPVEFWPDNFDAIRALTDLGVIVVEAAGNGQQDLDDPVYQGFFDRQERDSGAIMVGATAGSDLSPAWFSNHGSRLDLSGWGLNVVTAAYGDLQGGEETEWYTAQFSGTSSASPIVTGAVASLQGMAEASLGRTLDANLARELLRGTGTPTSGVQQIGPRPDLPAAHALLLAGGAGWLTGTVAASGPGLPLADATVKVEPAGPRMTTGPDGSYDLGLMPGSYLVSMAAYGHEPDTTLVLVGSGGDTVHDVDLVARPTEVISGVVTAAGGGPVADATVALLDEPVAPVISGADGAFAFAPVPAGDLHALQAGGVPGYGGLVLELPVTSLPAGQVVMAPLPTASWDFEDGAQGWTAQDGLWQRGEPAATGVGPGAAFDGAWCWGVGLDGDGYPDQATGELWSPLLQGADRAGEKLQLGLHYWCGTEPGFDGVHVVLNPGPDAQVLAPYGDYTDPVLGGLGHRPGWSGDSGGWRTAVFDLTDQLDATDWRVAVRFGSDQAVGGEGFLIDGITLHAFDVATAAAPTPPVDAATLDAWPNPFNPQVTLAWSLPSAGPLWLDVFDLRGRRVAGLVAGEARPARGTMVWDGADARGRALPSGVYLVRARGDGATATRRITLAR